MLFYKFFSPFMCSNNSNRKLDYRVDQILIEGDRLYVDALTIGVIPDTETISLNYLPRGGSRGGVQGVRTPPWAQTIIKHVNVSYHTYDRTNGAPPPSAPLPKKNPGSAPVARYGCWSMETNTNKSLIEATKSNQQRL